LLGKRDAARVVDAEVRTELECPADECPHRRDLDGSGEHFLQQERGVFVRDRTLAHCTGEPRCDLGEEQFGRCDLVVEVAAGWVRRLVEEEFRVRRRVGNDHRSSSNDGRSGNPQ
jgi:hypothetical protein